MNKKPILLSSLFCTIIISFTGCLDIFEDITTPQVIYEQHPTKLAYHIQYGYQLSLNGTGTANVYYREDLPEPLDGVIYNISVLNPLQSQIETLEQNDMIIWNETFDDTQQLFLGLQANISSESVMISTLKDENALSLDLIKEQQPSLVNQYCNIQGNRTEIIINPTDPQIKQVALTLKQNLQSNNTFLLAKELFRWLKTETQYRTHMSNQKIQPCVETYQKKTGDCDDLSFLYISLCRSISIPARFIRGYLISEQDNQVQMIPHVWVEIYTGNASFNNGWIPVECAGIGSIEAEIHQNFGVEDAHHLRLFIDNGTNKSMNIYTNHISIEYGQGLSITIQNKTNISAYEVLESKKLCIKHNNRRKYC